MNTAPSRRGRLRAAITIGTVAVAALALAGCSSDTSTPSASESASATAGGSDLAARVAKLMEPVDAYPVPTEKVDGSVLEGKTVYYIPITSQAPKFAVVAAGLTDALATVGASVQVCDGKGTPTDISACVSQATQAGAAAIVTDAIYYNMVANALDDAQAAGIPVLNTNQGPADGHPASDTLSYAVEAGNGGASALAEWVSLDSAGAADILANVSVDGPAPKIYFGEAQDILAEDCTDCTVTINEVTASNFGQIPSSTSAALLKDPGIGYVWAQFEQYLQVTQGGVQQAGMADSVKGMIGAATLGGLQQLAANNFLYAAVSDASTFNGWLDADAVIRLVAGTEVPDYTIPERLFTRENIGSITLTEDAQASGEWFGPTEFPEQFAALWGAQ